MFDLLSAHQIHFQLFFEVTKRGKFPRFYELSMKILSLHTLDYT